MKYAWLSFSNGNIPSPNNIGAVCITVDRDMSPEELVEESCSRGFTPPTATSILGAMIDEDTASDFPSNQFMTRQELTTILAEKVVIQKFDN